MGLPTVKLEKGNLLVTTDKLANMRESDRPILGKSSLRLSSNRQATLILAPIPENAHEFSTSTAL